MNTWTQPARRFPRNWNARRVGVDLHHEVDRHAVVFAEGDQAVEDLLPRRVPGEVVVGEEVVADALRPAAEKVVVADLGEDVAGAAAAHPSPLDVDDCAEGAVEWAPAPGIDRAAVLQRELPLRLRRRAGDGLVGQVGQVGEKVVERLEPIGGGIAQQPGPSVLDLSEHQGHARVDHLPALRRHRGGHGHRAADVETADATSNPSALNCRARSCARKLVRLTPAADDDLCVGPPIIRPSLVARPGHDRQSPDGHLKPIELAVADRVLGQLLRQLSVLLERAPQMSDDLPVIVILWTADENHTRRLYGKRARVTAGKDSETASVLQRVSRRSSRSGWHDSRPGPDAWQPDAWESQLHDARASPTAVDTPP
jgi:hypothetical protein